MLVRRQRKSGLTGDNLACRGDIQANIIVHDEDEGVSVRLSTLFAGTCILGHHDLAGFLTLIAGDFDTLQVACRN